MDGLAGYQVDVPSHRLKDFEREGEATGQKFDLTERSPIIEAEEQKKGTSSNSGRAKKYK
jgi:hypothetical protein